jgi:hypothetical protein
MANVPVPWRVPGVMPRHLAPCTTTVLLPEKMDRADALCILDIATSVPGGIRACKDGICLILKEFFFAGELRWRKTVGVIRHT